MPRLRYNVATTVDGFIASPDGSTDWILDDLTIDFDALYDEFSTFVMGRKTYEVMLHHARASGTNPFAGRRVIVVSRTMKQGDGPSIEVLAHGHLELVAKLKAGQGKDIWLMGGGRLARDFLEAGLLDTVETAIMPVMIGNGTKMILPMPKEASTWELALQSVERKTSGILMLVYTVLRS
ncbi:hypothetical protein ACHAQA_001549 [Verticillium albo-atrum]